MNDEIHLDDVITIICDIHGEFEIKARDHIGENPERTAYGCPKCNSVLYLDN